MLKTAITFVVASALVTGCLFPSFDDMQGKGSKDGTPGSDDKATEAGNDTKTTAGASTTDPIAITTTDGGASNTGATTTTTTDASAAPKGPATIACGGKTCAGGSSNYCCSAWGGECHTSGDPSSCAIGTLRAFTCDENSDCTGGQKCCFVDSENLGTCRADCGGGVVLCRNPNPDCPAGKSCTGTLDFDLGVKVSFCK